jgi:hypothetical protein
MNERIEELWDKAAEDTMDNSWQSQTKFMERFAELIVRECTGICESMQLLGPYKDVQESTLKDAAIQIKEHFGVKE